MPAPASDHFVEAARDRNAVSVIIHFRRRSCSIAIAQVASGSQRPAASSPVLRLLFPKSVLTTEMIGQAMLEVARHGAPKAVLEAADISAICTAAAHSA